MFQHFDIWTGEQYDSKTIPETNASPNTLRTDPHITLNPLYIYQPVSTTATLPFGCHQIALKYSWHSSQPKNQPGSEPPPPPCCGRTPCFSAHLQPDATRLALQHCARPQADGHHAEGPLCQRTPRDQGPRRTPALKHKFRCGNRPMSCMLWASYYSRSPNSSSVH